MEALPEKRGKSFSFYVSRTDGHFSKTNNLLFGFLSRRREVDNSMICSIHYPCICNSTRMCLHAWLCTDLLACSVRSDCGKWKRDWAWRKDTRRKVGVLSPLPHPTIFSLTRCLSFTPQNLLFLSAAMVIVNGCSSFLSFSTFPSAAREWFSRWYGSHPSRGSSTIWRHGSALAWKRITAGQCVVRDDEIQEKGWKLLTRNTFEA